MGRAVLSLCAGAGGLDLGFERAGFGPVLAAVDSDGACVRTLLHNRPNWRVVLRDIRDYTHCGPRPDVLLAGCPCQGYSLGGRRDGADPRNQLFRTVAKIVGECRPKLVVFENVLNLRNMTFRGKPYHAAIVEAMAKVGYLGTWRAYRMSRWGVPQTRQRIIFLFGDGFAPELPREPDVPDEPARRWLENVTGPNHRRNWRWVSRVHKKTGEASDGRLTAFRSSRTASFGHPIRTLDKPFPTVDTATIWAWAEGQVKAKRVRGLWRVEVSRMRPFTMREYARLQTFPDDWLFAGLPADVRRQIGNAVPVAFAERLARHLLAYF